MSTNGTAKHAPIPVATRLRQLLAEKDILVVPGVYDGFRARIALEVGFDCLYMVRTLPKNLLGKLHTNTRKPGAGTCASKLGQTDLGFASLNDMREHGEMIANLNTGTPLIADAHTGYGGPNMVARTVAQYHRSGIAGLHIEDQPEECAGY